MKPMHCLKERELGGEADEMAAKGERRAGAGIEGEGTEMKEEVEHKKDRKRRRNSLRIFRANPQERKMDVYIPAKM